MHVKVQNGENREECEAVSEGDPDVYRVYSLTHDVYRFLTRLKAMKRLGAAAYEHVSEA